MKYHAGMSDTELSEWRRLMLRKGKMLGYNKSDIARIIGTNLQNLDNIIRRPSRNSEFAVKLDDWLVRNVEMVTERRDEQDVLANVASQLETLASALRDVRFSLDSRIGHLEVLWSAIGTMIPNLRAVAEEEATQDGGNGSATRPSPRP